MITLTLAQIPQDLWKEARICREESCQARVAGSGSPEWVAAETTGRAFNRRLLAYNRGFKKRYPGGVIQKRMEDLLYLKQLTIKMLLYQVCYPNSYPAGSTDRDRLVLT